MDKSQSYSGGDYYTRPNPELSVVDRVSMVEDMVAIGVDVRVLMYATDRVLVSMHREHFPNPFMVAVDKVLEGRTL